MLLSLEHKQGYLSVYKHNESLNIMFRGTLFKPEIVIATVGNTGEYSTGYHLHFELWNEGFPLDPQDFINFSPLDFYFMYPKYSEKICEAILHLKTKSWIKNPIKVSIKNTLSTLIENGQKNIYLADQHFFQRHKKI